MGIIITNKKAYYEYQILETFEAGMVLTGPEVKSIRQNQINLSGGYITIDANAAVWLTNVYIAPYAPAAQVQQNYDPRQSRKLLLRKKEINTLVGKLKIKGLTIVPLKVYTKNKFIKIVIGIARGKKKWDKRENIKQKSWQRRKKRLLDS